MIVRRFLVFKAQCAVGGEFHFLQRLEHARDVEVSLADDHAVCPFFLFGKILQVNAVQAVAELVDDLDRVFTGANVVAKVCAEADAFVVSLDCLEPVINLLV